MDRRLCLVPSARARPSGIRNLIRRNGGVDPVLDTPSERAGDLIGPHKILQRLGEGGFGSEYMAEQDKPVRRTVAIKIIKLGMDTRQVVARFEQERQALAIDGPPEHRSRA